MKKSWLLTYGTFVGGFQLMVFQHTDHWAIGLAASTAIYFAARKLWQMFDWDWY